MQPGFEIFSRLLEQRIVFIGTPIDDMVSILVVGQLQKLEAQDRSREVSLYINSPGGSVPSSLAIYDTMQLLRCPVATYAIGQATGTAALLLGAGRHGRRFALTHARIAFMKIGGGARSEEQATEIARLTKVLDEAFALHTRQPLPEIVRARETERHFGAEAARTFGLVDQVIAEVPD
ncbi:MAG: ATP-dependent Clp protease proteolytic subunit [Planctomycetota bacterium]